MVRDDGKCQKQRCSEGSAPVLDAHRNGQRDEAKQDAKRNRHQHQIDGPRDATRYLQRPHAEVVHGDNAGADDRAADRRPPSGIVGGKPETNRRDRHGGSERRSRQGHAIARRHAGIVGQHGNEMRRPDAVSDRAAGDPDPQPARWRLCRDRAVEDIDGDDADGKADDPGEHNEPPVMLCSEAGEDAKHGCHGPRCRVDHKSAWIAILLSVLRVLKPSLTGRKGKPTDCNGLPTNFVMDVSPSSPGAARCRLLLQDRTNAGTAGMVAKGREETHAPPPRQQRYSATWSARAINVVATRRHCFIRLKKPHGPDSGCGRDTGRGRSARCDCIWVGCWPKHALPEGLRVAIHPKAVSLCSLRVLPVMTRSRT